MIIAAIVAFIATGAAIVVAAIKANKVQDSWTSTDENRIADITEREEKL